MKPRLYYTDQGEKTREYLKEKYLKKLENLAKRSRDAYHADSNSYELTSGTLYEADSKMVIQQLDPKRHIPKVAKFLFFTTLLFLFVFGLSFERIATMWQVDTMDVFVIGSTLISTMFGVLAIYGLFSPAEYFPDYERRAYENALYEVAELRVKMVNDQRELLAKMEQIVDRANVK